MWKYLICHFQRQRGKENILIDSKWNRISGASSTAAFELLTDLSDWGNAVRKIQYSLEGSSL